MSRTRPFRPVAWFILACTVLAAIVAVYAVPLEDGDIWFHLAYGRYLLENRTLIPDHTVFSWTPTDNSTIYCAWIPQVLFFLLFQAGGLSALYALRIVSVVVFLALVLSRARPWEKTEALPVTLLAVLLGSLMSMGGLRIKPEIFSFLFMTVMTWAWFAVKEKPARAWPLFSIFPAVMLLWVNSHGGFIFGVVFLCLVLAGETANTLLGSRARLDARARTHLLIAVAASLAVLFLTPYGWSYPAQLVDQLVIHPAEFRLHMQTIAEYQSVFFPQASHLHFAGFLVLSLVVLAALTAAHVRRGRTDWALVLVNGAFIVLYMRYFRTTYFWAIVFGFSCAHLIRTMPGDAPAVWGGKPVRIAVQGVVLACLLLLSLRALHDTRYLPSRGLNPSYVSPVEEGEYIKTAFPRARIGNDYATGSYLLWALWPGNRVFIDARYFPYRSWYSEYDRFELTRDSGEFHRFLKQYDCDLWCISHDNHLVALFTASPDWRLVHYGPSACIFLSADEPFPEGKRTAAASMDRAGFYRRYEIARFAAGMGDMEEARAIVRSLRPGLFSLRQAHLAVNAGLNAGNGLLARGRYLEAAAVYRDTLDRAARHPLLGTPLDRHGPSDRALVHGNLGQALLRAGRPGEALRELETALRLDPALQGAGKYRDLAQGQVARIDAAIAELETALRAAPGNLGALRSLAGLHVMRGDFEAGLEAARRVLDKDPENPDNSYNMACILARQGRSEEALKWLSRAVDRGFADSYLLRTDPDLEAVRDSDAFRVLERRVRGGEVRQ